jgi:DNA polymerase-1
MIALDIESTGKNPRKDKVIGFSVHDGKESYYVIHLKWNGTELEEVVPKETCINMLNELCRQPIITHGGTFDAQFIKNYFGVDILPSLAVDTMLLAHIINENELIYGLKELSAKYLGADSKDEQDELKKYLGKDKAFYKVPIEVLSKYAKKDVELTYRLWQYLDAKLTPRLRELFDDEIMPLYTTVIIPMQARGVMVDVPKMQKALAEITVDVEKFKAELMAEITPVTESFYNWYYDKRYPLKSRGLVYNKMKLGLSLRDAQRAVATDKGDEGFNIQSRHHLADLFFKIYKMEPLSRTEKGAPQVNEDFLDHAAKTLPWVNNLIIFNKLMKIKSTYYERILEEQEGGVFYPDYFLHRTTSGRMSGDQQQLPRPVESGHPLLLKYTNQIREFFISRPGMIFADTDYNSLEPRCFASNAGDESLFNIFRNGMDFYSTVAIMVEGYAEASADKSAPNYLGKINKEARQKAKSYSLGIAYGLDDYKLHKDLNISQNDAKRLVRQYMAAFPKLAATMQHNRETLLSMGQVETRFGRVRRQPEVPGLYTKHGPAILNALELWKKYNETPAIYKRAKEDYRTVRHALNNSLNFPVQGMAAHILNRAVIKMARIFKEQNLDAHIIACIHDQVIVELKQGLESVVGTIIQDCMENTTKIESGLEAIPAFGHNFREAH